MVESIKDYRWSSYHQNALGIVDALVTPHRLYKALAQGKEARQLCYKQLFEGRLHLETIQLFNESVGKGDVLGDASYHRRIERLIGRRPIKGHHGGDRKSERFNNSTTLIP